MQQKNKLEIIKNQHFLLKYHIKATKGIKIYEINPK